MTKRQMRLTPELVAKVPAYTGEYRPQASVKTPDETYEKLTDDVLAARPDSGELWVFAFGSLIWKPGPEFGVRRPGVIRGWHRAFCLGLDRAYRGNPVNPGLMLSLDRGGQCQGVAMQIIDQPSQRANLLAVIRREPVLPTPWVTVKTADGPLRAIVFANDRKSSYYFGGVSDDALADMQAKASGKFGSMAEYVMNTVSHLEELGIHDAHLWAMQEKIALRLEQA